MKRCPRCGSEFPDEYQLCTRDMNPLVPIVSGVPPLPLPAPRSSHSFTPLIVVGAILFVLLLAGIGLYVGIQSMSPTNNETSGRETPPPPPSPTVVTPESSGSSSIPQPPTESELSAALRLAVADHQTFAGESTLSDTGKSYAFTLRFTDYDPKENKVEGELTWTKLNSHSHFTGKVEEEELILDETGSEGEEGAVYTLIRKSGNIFTGTWKLETKGRRGTILFQPARPEESRSKPSESNQDKPSATSSQGDVSKRLLTEADLAGKSAWDLTLLRNEPYARHGYRFHLNKKVADYFESRPWYHPNSDDMQQVESQFSEIERKNTAFIRDYQDRNNLLIK